MRASLGSLYLAEVSFASLLVLGAPTAIFLLYVIVQYNGLVALRNHIRDAWSNIDAELQRRYELIPNLVATVKGYATHERELLERVLELRNRCVTSQGPRSAQAADEQQLVEGLRQLFALIEDYPDLKASQNFLQLQGELVNTEDRIQAARRFFNGNVRDYRNKYESFPSNLVARVGGFQEEGFFQVSPSVREVPDVDL